MQAVTAGPPGFTQVAATPSTQHGEGLTGWAQPVDERHQSHIHPFYSVTLTLNPV